MFKKLGLGILQRTAFQRGITPILRPVPLNLRSLPVRTYIWGLGRLWCRQGWRRQPKVRDASVTFELPKSLGGCIPGHLSRPHLKAGRPVLPATQRRQHLVFSLALFVSIAGLGPGSTFDLQQGGCAVSPPLSVEGGHADGYRAAQGCAQRRPRQGEAIDRGRRDSGQRTRGSGAKSFAQVKIIHT